MRGVLERLRWPAALPELPLFRHELVGLLRTRKAFWLVLAAMALSALVPLTVWPREGDLAGRGFENAGTVLAFFVTQLASALLILPAVTAGAIAGERERDTYDALYATLLSPATIVLSKARATAAFAVVLLVASAPAAFVLYLLGGVAFETFLRCYAITFASLVMSGLFCLSASMRSRSTAHAAVRGVVAVVLWNGGIYLLLWLGFMVLDSLTGARRWLPGWGPLGWGPSEVLLGLLAFALCPFFPLAAEIVPTGFFFRGGALPLEPWAAYSCGAALYALWPLLVLLRRARTPEAAARGWLERRRAARVAARRAGPARRSLFTRRLIALGEDRWPWLDNPVFLKEVRAEFFSRLGFRRALFWGSLAVFVLIGLIDEPAEERFLAISITALVLTCLIAPGIAASALPREVEQGNLDFLRGTALTLHEVVDGKLLAAFYSTWGILAAAGWAGAVVLAFGGSRNPSWRGASLDPLERLSLWATAALILLAAHAFVTALSTYASTLSRRSTGALVLAYGGVLVAYLGWPMLLLLGHGLSGIGMLAATNPFILLWGLIEPALGRGEPSGYLIFLFFLPLHAGGAAIFWILAFSAAEHRLARDP